MATINCEDEGAMSVIQEDSETVLGCTQWSSRCHRRSTYTDKAAVEHIGQQCTHLEQVNRVIFDNIQHNNTSQRH